MGLIELKMIASFANEMFCGTHIDLDINIHVSQTSLSRKYTPVEFPLSMTNRVVMCHHNTLQQALRVDQLWSENSI